MSTQIGYVSSNTLQCHLDENTMWSQAICAYFSVPVMSDASVPSMSYVIVVEAHIAYASQQVIASLLEYEKPDFVALSGDMVSGFAWDGRKGWFEERCSPF